MADAEKEIDPRKGIEGEKAVEDVCGIRGDAEQAIPEAN